MNSTGGPLSFDMMLNDQNFQRQLSENERRIIGFSGKAVQESQRMDSAFSQLGRAAAGYFAFTELSQLPGKIVQVRGEFQQLEISFRTMLGSQEKANKLMADVTRFAAVTPYGLKDTAAATKQLLAYGEGASTVTETLRKLGDIASGIGAPLGDIAYLYGTTMTQGRLYTQDLNQFTGRGIPMIKELAAIFKVAEKDVKGLVEAGKVGFPEVQQVIENLTKSGSMFGGLMEAQSKSLPGLIAQLEDAIDMMFNDIGKANEGFAAGVITGATSIVENYQDVIDILKVIVATYGAYRAVLISTVAVQKLAALGTFYTEYMAMGKALGFATANQIAFNRAVLANPYAIAAAAIIGLITAVNVFKEDTSEAAKAQERIANSTNKVNESLAGELSKVQLLTAQIKNENVSRDERNKKLNELISLHPKILGGITQENIATAEGTKAINEYIEARKRQIEVEQLNLELTDSIKRQLDAKNGKNELGFMSSVSLSMSSAGGSGFSAGTGTDFTNSVATARKKLNADIIKQEADLQKKILERVNALNSADDAVNKNGTNTEKAVKRTVQWYDDEIKALKEKQAKEADNRNNFLAFQKEIDRLEAAKTRITGGKSSTADATKRAQDENQIAVKSLEEQLEDKKKMYELYYRWVEFYGQESADKQFELLLSKNKTFIDFIQSEIAKLEKDKVTPGIGLIGPEETYLVKLRESRNELTGVDTPMQKFAKEMDAARSSSQSLTEEIIKLKELQSGLGTSDMSLDAIAKRQQLQERINEATKERNAQLREFLVSVVGSEQKRLEIETHYKNLRVALEEKYANDKGATYQKALSEINAAEQKEYLEQKGLLATRSKEFKELTKLIEDSTRDQTKVRVEAAKEQLRIILETYGEESEEYRQHLQALRSAEEDHRQKSARTWAMVGDAIGQVGVMLQELGGGLGEVGAGLSGLGSQMGNVSTAVNSVGSDGKMSADGWAAAIQGVIQMIGMVVSASKKRKEAVKQFALEAIKYENDYQLALTRQLGSAYKEGSNLFIDDIDARIKAGVNQYQEAQKQYQDALEKLENGRAKVSQKNAADGKSIGTGAGAGAAIGAAIGVWAFGVGAVVGAAVGAVIGGIVGLFAGKKKKDVFGGLLDEYPQLVKEGVDGWKELDVEMAKALIVNNQIDAKTKEMLETAIAYNEQLQESREQIKEGLSDLAGSLGDNVRDALVGAFKEGTDAALAFGKAVGNVIADMSSKLLFNALFKDSFDKLQAEMLASYSDINGDQTIIDDLTRFFQDNKDKPAQYLEGLEAINQIMEASGFKDIFEKNAARANSMSGTLKGMSEESASQFIGQFNASRIIQAESLSVNREQLIQLTLIASHTYHLISIDRKLDKLSKLDNLGNDPLRAKGLTL